MCNIFDFSFPPVSSDNNQHGDCAINWHAAGNHTLYKEKVEVDKYAPQSVEIYFANTWQYGPLAQLVRASC